MALGYVIALVLIGSGSALLVVGLLMVRQEARERAEDLKALLKTGAVPAHPIAATGHLDARFRRGAEIVHLPMRGAGHEDASLALRRAYYRSRVRSAA